MATTRYMRNVWVPTMEGWTKARKPGIGVGSRSKNVSLYLNLYRAMLRQFAREELSPVDEMALRAFLGPWQAVEIIEKPKVRYGTNEIIQKGRVRLHTLSGYTWVTPPTPDRIYRNSKGEAVVLRTVSMAHSPAGSWIYPPKVYEKNIVRTYRNRTGKVRVATTVFKVSPPRDLKPDLLKGRPYVSIPVKLSPDMVARAMHLSPPKPDFGQVMLPPRGRESTIAKLAMVLELMQKKRKKRKKS